MSKLLIHEFDPVVYPFKLWIMITNNADEMGMDCDRLKSNEHIAYLAGWMAECCEKVKNYKHNKTSLK